MSVTAPTVERTSVTVKVRDAAADETRKAAKGELYPEAGALLPDLIAAVKSSGAQAEADDVIGFMPDLTDKATGLRQKNLARAIHRALRKGQPTAARDLLVKATTEAPLVGSFAADAQAAIAAGFYYTGERAEAKALSFAAAGAKEPMGLWIQGLIAWEEGDSALAADAFSKLAAHPAPDNASRAAAAFWAGRAFTRLNKPTEAKKAYEAARKASRGFYGLLASARLGRAGGVEDASYPVPPWQPLKGFNVDRALLYALVRHESKFEPTAVSKNGACGLMQIMPATAYLVSASDDEAASLISEGRIFDPATNMTLGQKYVRHLAGTPLIGDNLVLLLASYNAGPSKVVQWMRGKKAGSDPLLFLEQIPMHETRNYVGRVLTHYWGYRARLGQSLASMAALAEGRWPRLSLTEGEHEAKAEAAETMKVAQLSIP